MSLVGIMTAVGYGLMLLLTLFIPEFAEPVFGSGGVVLAMAGTVVTSMDTANQGADRVVPDISSKLTKLAPDRFPLDTILRNLKNEEPAHNVKVGWEEVGYYPRAFTVNGLVAAAGGAKTAITVTLDGLANQLAIGDELLVQDTAGGYVTDWGTKRAYVSEIAPGGNPNQIKIFAWQSSSTDGFNVTAPAIPNNSVLIRYSDSKSEQEGPSTARAMEPSTIYNYVHTFEKVVKISRMRNNIKTFTESDMKRGMAQALWDFREDIENQFNFGIGGVGTNPLNNEKHYKMHGAEHFIQSNILDASTGITEGMFLEWAERISDDTHGSEQKLLFVSPSLMTKIAKLNITQESMRNGRRDKVLGTNVLRIETPYFEFLLKLHKGYGVAQKGDYGLVLDPQHIKRRPLEKMYRMELNLEEAGGQRVKAHKYVETCSFEVRYEATHAIIT